MLVTLLNYKKYEVYDPVDRTIGQRQTDGSRQIDISCRFVIEYLVSLDCEVKDTCEAPNYKYYKEDFHNEMVILFKHNQIRRFRRAA